ncbi:MAG: sulfite exporter TauE/SafE family protein [Deltaproteobacteria bacterium]|jgi:uncharacterized membrane protein YfcA|nr:sulfite exporter TauE/SafE family protein [Deltaproteobacteria bacterium]MBW2534273.1 sulfite exporter TauE/SafE family protein [Deltaproteobacteria bacterium]
MLALPAIFDSALVFLLCAAVMALAQTVYVLLGFGAGLIAVGLLALLLPEIQDVVVVLLLLNLPAELYVVRQTVRAVSWRSVLTLCAGIAVGVPVGTLLLQRTRPDIILLILGALLIVAGGAFLRSPGRAAIRWPPWVAPPTGLLAGILAGTFGTGGPPLILYYQLAGISKRAFRANLMAIFLLITCVRVPAYAVAGLITGERLHATLWMLPAVVLGAYLGNRIHLRLSEAIFRRTVSVALMVLGATLIAQRIGAGGFPG